jgi:hypothetical protein
MRKSRASFGATVNYAQKHNVDICFVQEPPASQGPFSSQYVYVRAGNSSRAALIISKNLEYALVEELEGQPLKTDILCCQIRIESNIFWIVSVYCDQTESIDETSECLKRILRCSKKLRAKTIFALDSNAWSLRWGSVKTRQNEYGQQWKRGRAIEELMDAEGLYLGGRLEDPTFQSKDGRESSIDITLQSCSGIISSYHMPPVDSLSDHMLISFMINLDSAMEGDRKEKYWMLRKIDWSMFGDRVDQLTAKVPEQGIDEMERGIIGSFKTAIDDVIPKQPIRAGKELWGKALRDLYRKLSGSRQRVKRNPDCPHSKAVGK